MSQQHSHDAVHKLRQQSSVPQLPQLSSAPSAPRARPGKGGPKGVVEGPLVNTEEEGKQTQHGALAISKSTYGATVPVVYKSGVPASTSRHRHRNVPLSLEIAGPLTARKFEMNDKLAALAATAEAGRMYGAGEAVHLVHDHLGKDGALLKSTAAKLAATADKKKGGTVSGTGGDDAEDGTISTWPSGKGGSKPNLLQHLETFVHEQLTVIHHSQGQDRETISVMRAEMVKYCLETFGQHFRTYRDVFETLYSSVDGLLALFEFHKEEIFKLRQNAEAREEEFLEKMGKREEWEAELKADMETLRGVADQFGPLEEDRKVLRAQNEDLQRQLTKLRNHVESQNEKEEYFRSRHVTHTIREVGMRNKADELETELTKIRLSMEEQVKARSDATIRMEQAEVDVERSNTERDFALNRVVAVEVQLSQVQEDLKMLRFERKKLLNQINSRGGGAPLHIDGAELNLDWAGGLGSPRSGASADRMTPRPDWDACQEALGEVNLEVQHSIPNRANNTNSPRARAAETDHSSTSPLATNMLISKTRETTPNNHNNNTPGSPRGGGSGGGMNPKSTRNKLMSVTNAILNLQDDLKESAERVEELESEVLVLRQVQELESQPVEMEGAHSYSSPKLTTPTNPRLTSPVAPPGGSAFPPTGGGGSVSSPKRNQKILAQLEEKIFVPCGDSGDIPKYLQTSSDNFNIKLRPMTLPMLLDHIDAAQTFIATKYLCIPPEHLGTKEALQDHLDERNLESSVNAPGAQPATFSAGFYRWLATTHPAEGSPGVGLAAAPSGARQKHSTTGGGSSKAAKAATDTLAGSTIISQDDETAAMGINSEMAYSIVYLAQHTYAGNVYCKMFLYQLSGEIPLSSFMFLRTHLRDLRGVLESMDRHGTNTIYLPLAMAELKKKLKYLSDHDIKVMTELARSPVPPPLSSSSLIANEKGRVGGGGIGGFRSPTAKKINPDRTGTGKVVGFVSPPRDSASNTHQVLSSPPVFYLPLLHRDHPFTQTFTAYFLSAILYQHLQLTRALVDLPYSANDDLPLNVVQQALCGADSQCPVETMRWFLAKCLRLKMAGGGSNPFNAKTKINTSLILFRMKEVFMRRATPMNVGLFNLETVDPPLLAQLQVQAALRSVHLSKDEVGGEAVDAEKTTEVLSSVKGPSRHHKAGQKRVVAGNRKQ